MGQSFWIGKDIYNNYKHKACLFSDKESKFRELKELMRQIHIELKGKILDC
jgi:hypothetical protein